MLNIEQFATLVAQSHAIRLAEPGMRGPNFTWKDSFPQMAEGHIRTQWWMANRSEKVFNAAVKSGMIDRITKEIATSFSKITGSP